MKKLSITLFLLSLAVIAAACVPNRLSQSLATREPGSAAPQIAPTPDGRNLQPQLDNATVNLSEVVTLLPPDAIPAILPNEVWSIMVPAAEADAAGMSQHTRVLGVSIEGDSRAYPVPFMSAHEIVNDEVGGKLIAATW